MLFLFHWHIGMATEFRVIPQGRSSNSSEEAFDIRAITIDEIQAIQSNEMDEKWKETDSILPQNTKPYLTFVSNQSCVQGSPSFSPAQRSMRRSCVLLVHEMRDLTFAVSGTLHLSQCLFSTLERNMANIITSNKQVVFIIQLNKINKQISYSLGYQ